MISLLLFWEKFRLFIASPVGYVPGYENYLEGAFYIIFPALFLSAIWKTYKTHPFGIIGIGLSGSDEAKKTSLANLWLGLFLLFVAHLGLNIYSTSNSIPAEVAHAHKTDLSIAQSNDLAELAHKHSITLNHACCINLKNLEIYVVGSTNNAVFYISESWLDSQETYNNFLVLAERQLIRLNNTSEMQQNIVHSSLFGLHAIMLAHLYLFPLTSVLFANMAICNLTLTLGAACKNYIWSQFYRMQTFKNDQETAKILGAQKLAASLEYVDSQIHYDLAVTTLPSWKLCIPPFHERIARLTTK